MASFLAHQYPSPGTSLPTLSSLFKYSQYPKTNQLTTSRPRRKNANYKVITTSQSRRNDGDIDDQNPSRRDLLIGLGGIYTAASNDPFALAAPILGPDLNQCQNNINVFGVIKPETCCLIRTSEPEPFNLPENPEVVLRPAAHQSHNDYYKMFEDAIQAMKDLPPEDPRSFINQAKIHCSYCNNAYNQSGSDEPFQVHNSALFFPFHRWYLYFFERICGHLIGKPDEFRLPFWNWDSPDGMTMPERYTLQSSPLYDELRAAGGSDIVDLQFGLDDKRRKLFDEKDRIRQNLGTMQNQMVNNSKGAADFFGTVFKAGKPDMVAGKPLVEVVGGSVENVPHVPVHRWVGGDMGSFHTAGRDPIFYAHHANVDRMWDMWKTNDMLIPGKQNMDLDDHDWRKTEFIFYNEHQKMVRVKVEDCLDSAKLGYKYDLSRESISPWLDFKKEAKSTTVNRLTNKYMMSGIPLPQPEKIAPIDIGKADLPIKLDKVVKYRVPRPTSDKKTSNEGEILVVQDIRVGTQDYVKFDVHVNDDNYLTTTPINAEFAGSFVSLEPGGHVHGDKDEKMNMDKAGTELKLSLTEILRDLKAGNDRFITVTLVPKTGCANVTVGGIRIDYRTIS